MRVGRFEGFSKPLGRFRWNRHLERHIGSLPLLGENGPSNGWLGRVFLLSALKVFEGAALARSLCSCSQWISPRRSGCQNQIKGVHVVLDGPTARKPGWLCQLEAGLLGDQKNELICRSESVYPDTTRKGTHAIRSIWRGA